jgi:hypothetical protein
LLAIRITASVLAAAKSKPAAIKFNADEPERLRRRALRRSLSGDSPLPSFSELSESVFDSLLGRLTRFFSGDSGMPVEGEEERTAVGARLQHGLP